MKCHVGGFRVHWVRFTDQREVSVGRSVWESSLRCKGLRKQSLGVTGDDPELIQRSVGAQGCRGSFRPIKKVVLEFRDVRGHVKILSGCSRGPEVLKWLLLFLER